MRVLLVEDDLLVRELVEEALFGEGVSVTTAGDGDGAIQILRSFKPDVLVTDINLGPGPTGFDVARRARDHNPDVPVVYITGHAAHLASEGVDGAVMVPKPFDPSKLALVVCDLRLSAD